MKLSIFQKAFFQKGDGENLDLRRRHFGTPSSSFFKISTGGDAVESDIFSGNILARFRFWWPKKLKTLMQHRNHDNSV